MRRSWRPVMPTACRVANSRRRVTMLVSTELTKFRMPMSPMMSESAPPMSSTVFCMFSNSAARVPLEE